MKKVWKVALGCICAASMMTAVGCNKDESSYTQQETLNGKTTQEKYEEIMDTIDTYSANFTSNTQFDIGVTMKMQGMKAKLNMEMKSTVKMDGENFEEVDFIDAGELMGEALGTMEMKAWYVDGVAYLDGTDSGSLEGSISQTKVKYTATIAEICEIAGLDEDSLWNPIYDFSGAAFEDVQFSVGKKDSYFTLTMTGDEAAAYAEKYVALQGVSGDITIPKINYKFVLDAEGNFQYAKINYEMTMVANVGGEQVTYSYKYNGKITFSDIGTTTVSAPAGSETWTDLTAYLR